LSIERNKEIFSRITKFPKQIYLDGFYTTEEKEGRMGCSSRVNIF
jgi:hypothetical protein